MTDTSAHKELLVVSQVDEAQRRRQALIFTFAASSESLSDFRIESDVVDTSRRPIERVSVLVKALEGASCFIGQLVAHVEIVCLSGFADWDGLGLRIE